MSCYIYCIQPLYVLMGGHMTVEKEIFSVSAIQIKLYTKLKCAVL